MLVDDVQQIEQRINPSQAVIEWWKETRPSDATLGTLVEILTKMERMDIVETLRTEFNVEIEVVRYM